MIYLDNAATSWPKPRGVMDAMLKTMRDFGANPGRSGHRMAINAGRILFYVRQAMCDLFHVSDPFQFVFCFNCTDALNLAIKGCLDDGDHVITTSLEHNSVLRPLKELEWQGKIDLTVVPSGPHGTVEAKQIQKALCPNTKLVVVNHVSNVTGAIQPIRAIGKICENHGALFLVDGAQSAGILPLDLEAMPIDYYAFAGHKGLLGPQGTGGLYIKKGRTLKPLREGGTGSNSESWFQPEDIPDRYESGTLNTPGIAGLGAGIRFILKHQKEILQKERELTRELIEGLLEIEGVRVYGPPLNLPRTGVVSFNIRSLQSGMVGDILDRDYQIACRAGLHCAPLVHRGQGTIDQGTVRISLGFFNTRDEIHQCLAAIQKISQHYKEAH